MWRSRGLALLIPFLPLLSHPAPSPPLQSDRLLKFKVLNDVLQLVTPLDWLPLTQASCMHGEY